MQMHLPLRSLVACLLAICAAVTATAQDATSPPDLAAINRLASTGRGQQALEQIDKLAAAQPNLPGLERARGTAYYSMDRLKDAEAAFGRALAQNPHDDESAQMRGLALFRLGRPAEAIPLLEASHKAGLQQKADPTYVLALCYTDARRYDDARRAYAAQYGLPPDSAAGYLLAARMLLRREYLPVALKFAEQAATLDPKLPLAHEVLGEIALAQNRLDDAANAFDAERSANPLEPAPYERLGDLYGRQGRYTEARESLQRAVLLEPNATGPYILLGKTSLKQGDAVAALTYLQRAEHMDPANYMTHNLLAQTYRALGHAAEASRELELTQKIQAADAPKLTPAE